MGGGGKRGLRNVCIKSTSFSFRLNLLMNGKETLSHKISHFSLKLANRAVEFERSKFGSFGDFLPIFKTAYLPNEKS